MESIPWRVRIGVVVAGYVSVVAASAVLIFERYQQYAEHPGDVAASGGMYAAGDWMLSVFVALMLLGATILLIVVIRNVAAAYTRFAQILFGISLTAPLCLGLMSIPAVGQSNSIFAYACLYRVWTSPVVILGLMISRVAAKFDPAKRWISYAALIEVITLGLGIVGLFLARRL